MSAGVESYKKRLYLERFQVIDGKTYPGSSERFKQISEFRIKPDDVAIVCYPKSGTHWLYRIISYLNSDEDLDKMKHYPFIPMEVSDPRGAMNPLELIEKCPSPRVITTHLPFELCPRDLQDAKCKVVLVIRNPKDVAVSYYPFMKKMEKLGKFADMPWEEFLEAYLDPTAVMYSTWFENVKSWLNHRDDLNILLVRYEDLKKDLVKGVTNVAEFLGRPVSGDRAAKIAELCEFGNMKKKADKDKEGQVFMRKGIVGDWKSQFTVAQSEMFDEIYSKEMTKFDLKIDFEN